MSIMFFKKLSQALVYYFYPHEGNNFKAKILHHQYLFGFIVLLSFYQILFPLYKRSHPEILGFAKDITIDRILVLVNEERGKENLSPLTLNPELTIAAAKKGTDMFGKNYWAHISPTGTTQWQFITDSGYQYAYAGENLAKSFNTSEEVVNAWINSPTHRANIMKKEYTDIGLAIMNGSLNGEETTLVVQEFGARTSTAQANSKLVSAKAKISPTVAVDINPFLAGNSPLTNDNPDKLSAGSLLNSVSKMQKTISLIVAEMMLVALFIDSIYIWKHQILRVSGHNFAHLVFFAALLIAMGATGIGVIL